MSADATNGNGNGDIRYTVKEMLAGLDRKLDDIKRALDSKADMKAFEDLSTRVRDIELRGSPHLQNVQAKVDEVARSLSDIEQGKNLSPYAANLILDFGEVKKKVDQFWKIIVVAGGVGGAIGYGASILSKLLN